MPTLAEIVNDNPGAARVLERHHLDYCCGGRQTLQRACEDGGVDVDRVLSELAAAAPSAAPAAWTAMGPAELVDHLEATHHAFLHEELPRLEALAAKVLAAHGGRHPELDHVARLVHALRADLEPHLAKEERVLFPMIRALASGSTAPPSHCGTIANPIRVMLLEHDQAGELLAATRAASDGYAPPTDACASYRALYRGLHDLEVDTHLHVHKENNILFPAVLELEGARPPAP